MPSRAARKSGGSGVKPNSPLSGEYGSSRDAGHHQRDRGQQAGGAAPVERPAGPDHQEDEQLGPTGTLVLEVVPGSMAEAAGVQVGDHLVRIGEIDASSEDFGARYRERYADLAEGSPMDIVVRRNNRDLVLPGRFRLVVQVERRLEFVEGASPKAARIRAGILHGTTGP